jgi:hypothetical protein
MYAIRSAIACGGRAASSPSGISDSDELEMSFKSARKIVSSIPPGLRSVILVAVSVAMIPLISRPSFVVAV